MTARNGRRPFVAVAALALWVLAGCSGPTSQDNEDAARLTNLAGFGIPHASLTVIAEKQVTWMGEADGTGRIDVASLPSQGQLYIGAPGYGTVSIHLPILPGTIELAEGQDEGPFLRSSEPVRLVCPGGPVEDARDEVYDIASRGAYRSCDGFSEPVLEVAADGTIWASATGHPSRAPTIWTSRDAGQNFVARPASGTEASRTAVGMEGDFAIDEAGNVFFFDITLATGLLTSYTGQGSHRFTLPLAFDGGVDRPWVQAGAEDEVFFLYNAMLHYYEEGEPVAGMYGSEFRYSTTGGLTIDDSRSHTFPCPTMHLGQGPARDRLFTVGCFPTASSVTKGSQWHAPHLWLSEDGGRTWGDAEEVPVPPGPIEYVGHSYYFIQATADAAGNIYVVYPRLESANATEMDVYMSSRSPAGEWEGPFKVSQGGTNFRMWAAAGAPGMLGVVWYHTEAPFYAYRPGLEGADDDGRWYVMGAVSANADNETPVFQSAALDPEPILMGPWQGQNNLGHLHQSALTPDGRLATAYAKKLPGSGIETWVVLSDGVVDLGTASTRS